MNDEHIRAAKLAEVDLRILVRLYEAGPDFLVHIAANDILEPAIQGVVVDDVMARMGHLGSEDEVHGTPTATGLGMARLSPLMKQRLEDLAPKVLDREGETWLERIRWVFTRGSEAREILVTRDQVLERGFGRWVAVGPG